MILLAHLLLVCALGILTDVVVAAYIHAVAVRRPVLAASLSTAVTLLNLGVLGALYLWISESGLPLVAAYAGGNWIGTYCVVRR